MRNTTAHTNAGYRSDPMLKHTSGGQNTQDRKRQRKIGIAGICAWTVVLCIVIARAYFKKPKSSFNF